MGPLGRGEGRAFQGEGIAHGKMLQDENKHGGFEVRKKVNVTVI